MCWDGHCQPRHPVQALYADPLQRAVLEVRGGGPLTTWWARIELPEEFPNRIDDNLDIVDFVFSERRIDGAVGRGLAEGTPHALLLVADDDQL